MMVSLKNFAVNDTMTMISLGTQLYNDKVSKGLR